MIQLSELYLRHGDWILHHSTVSSALFGILSANIGDSGYHLGEETHYVSLPAKKYAKKIEVVLFKRK